MSIDATSWLVDLPESAKHLRGVPLKSPRKGLLLNRTRFNRTKLSVAPTNDQYVSPNNCEGALYLVKSFGAPGVMFEANWRSTSSFVLTYWQWGPGHWAQGN